MTERETPQEIRTLTEDEMARQAGFDHKYGFIQAHDPEFEPICDKYVGILRQLDGQPKADFFHMRHFHSYDDQAALWNRMAETDEDAAAWKAVLDEARSAMWSDYQKEYASTKQLSQELIRLGLGRLATHPDVCRVERGTVGKYQGEYQSNPTVFHLVHNDYGEDEAISIELPISPVPFDYRLLDDDRYSLARLQQPYLRHEVKTKGHRLMQAGEIVSFTKLGGHKNLVIDSEEGQHDSFDRLRILNYVGLPKEIAARDDEYSLDSKSIKALLEMVKTAKPVEATKA